LVGYWPLLSRGALIKDHSGKGNHLTNQGATFQGENTLVFDGTSNLIQNALLSGSGTGAQVVLTAGSAFIDNLSLNWNAYIGHFIHLVDTGSKHCTGFIGHSSGNGVAIYSSVSLANQSWLSADSGFDTVNVSTYTILSSDLQIVGDTTIGMWFKRGVSDFAEDKCLINRFTVSEFALFFNGSTERLTFLVYGPAGTSMSVTTQNAYTSITDWYFVTVTYNATSTDIKICINGVLANTPVHTGFSTLKNSYSLLHIGNLTSGNRFAGKIAHPFIYQCELYQAEIQKIYTGVKP